MKKLLYLFLGLLLVACTEKETESREIRGYHANGELKFIANYKGNESARYVHRSGLQFLETYEIDEIAGQVAQSGLYGFMTAGNEVIIGYASLKGKKGIDKLIQSPDFKKIFPQDMKFCWGAEMRVEPGGAKEPRYLLYAVKIPQENAEIINGMDLAEATLNEETHTIDLQMTVLGTEKFHSLTKKNVNRYVAILIDGQLAAAPLVVMPIPEGKVSIGGKLSDVSVNKLVNSLNEEVLNGEFRTYDEQGKLLQSRRYVKGERVGSPDKK